MSPGGLAEGLEIPGSAQVPKRVIRGSSAPLSPSQLRALANAAVSIVYVAKKIGMDIPHYSRGSIKIHCPFGEFWHRDGGSEQAMRIYEDTNTCWCFACSKLYTPVMLYALTYDVTEYEASETLLKEVAPNLANNNFDLDTILLNLRDPELQPDTASLAIALDLFCRRAHLNWDMLQFDSHVSSVYLKCLALLDKIASEQDAWHWLAVSKEIMSNILDKA